MDVWTVIDDRPAIGFAATQAGFGAFEDCVCKKQVVVPSVWVCNPNLFYAQHVMFLSTLKLWIEFSDIIIIIIIIITIIIISIIFIIIFGCREGEEESNYETLETDQNYEIIRKAHIEK